MTKALQAHIRDKKGDGREKGTLLERTGKASKAKKDGYRKVGVKYNSTIVKNQARSLTEIAGACGEKVDTIRRRSKYR